MPLSSDEGVVKVSQDLVDQLQAIFGKHPGFRPAHAKGLMLHGTFTPTPTAKALSSAPHFNQSSTPITARFSSSTGIPQIPDTDPNGDPRGFAIRFNLGDRKHDDVIAHSTPFFPTRTGAEFLEFLKALAASPPGGPSPSPVEQFLGSHPKALAFVQAPKPTPKSFATEEYFGVTALKFVSEEGKEKFFRYRVLPDEGLQTLSGEDLSGKGNEFLQEEIRGRMEEGGSGATFKLMAQIAEEGDVIDDATENWPETREVVELGTIKLEGVVPDSEKEQKHVIFDPIPRVQGIEPSNDPLLELRAAVYLISGRQRRAA